MTVEPQPIESILPDVTQAIGKANWQLQDLAVRCQHGRYPEQMVERIDVLYCEIDAACDRLRQALVARQTGRDALRGSMAKAGGA